MYNMNKCGISLKVKHEVSNLEKIGQYNHSAPINYETEII